MKALSFLLLLLPALALAQDSTNQIRIAGTNIAVVSLDRADSTNNENLLFYFQRGQDFEKRRLVSQDYGTDPTDRLIRQLNQINADLAIYTNLVTKPAFTNRTPEQQAFTRGSLVYALQSQLTVYHALVDRQAELERDINQLTIDKQRQFMRSFYGY